MFPCFDQTDLLYDYGLWIPGDAYRSITPSVSSEGSHKEEEEKEKEEKEPEIDLDHEGSYAEKVDAKSVAGKFRQFAGGSSTLPTSKGGALARSLGLAPSVADEKRFITEFGNSATFAQTEQWLISCAHPEDEIQFMEKTFKAFDRDHKGTLSRSQIINILTSFGEGLTEEEASKTLSLLGFGDPVNYHNLVEKLLMA